MESKADLHKAQLEMLQKRLEQLETERDALARRLSTLDQDASQHHWLPVINAIRDPVFVHDAQFRVVLANRAYADLAQVPMEKAIGQLYWKLFPRQSGPMASCVKALSLQCEQHEEIRLATGETFVSRSFPVRDTNNKYVSSVHILHDVTEQRRLENETRIQDEALRHSAEAILIVDDGLKISFVNPAFCKLFNYDRQDILGQPVSELSHIEDIGHIDHDQIISYIRDNDTSWSGNAYIRSGEGAPIPVHLSASPIKDSAGHTIGFVKHYIDMRKVDKAIRQVETLHGVIEDLSTKLDLDAIGNAAIRSAVKLLESDTGFICLYNDARDKVYHHWHVGLPESETRNLLRAYDPSEGLTGQILASGQPGIVEDYNKHQKTIEEYMHLGIKSVIGVPIIIEGIVEGVMFVATLNRSMDYTSEHISFLKSIARQMGVGIQRRRLISDLENSRTYLNHIINAVPDIIYQGRPDNSSIPFVSDAVTDILGFAPEDFINDPKLWEKQIHNDDATRVFDYFHRVFDSQAMTFSIEYRVRHKNGREYSWIEDRGTIERDENGQPTRIFGSASDITQRKFFQRKLEESQARFSDLFNNIKSGVAVYRAVDDGKYFVFTDFNRGAENIEKIRREDVINRELLDVFPAAKDFGFVEVLRRVYKTGNIESHPVFFYKDGRIEGWRDNTLYRLKTGEVVAVYDDITERKRAEVSLDRVNRALKTLSACNHALVHAKTEQDLLDEICQNICENGGYPMSCVCYIDGNTSSPLLEPVAHFGFASNYVKALARHLAEPTHDDLSTRSPELTVIQNREPFILPSIPLAQKDWPWSIIARAYECSSLICMPVIHNNLVIGALTILGKETSAFDDDEVILLNELASDLGYGIMTLRGHEERKALEQREHFSHQRLQDSLVSTIQAIATSMEKRDPYTAGHQRNVAKLSTAIAREMGLPEEQINGLRLGALIHDIGKIYVPAEILNRPGKLTDAEFEIIKSHPEVGHEIIKGVDFPWPVNEIVLQHHERLNGSGYPLGLMGHQIALEARILAVADVVEAMASHRPYRPGLGIDAALAELNSHRGTLYEPEVVDKCIDLFNSKRFAFDAQHPNI